ncbi:MAG TPA: family 43 glycosylhydrolase [Vicinamibacterales bacterium]|nr:family 43 glycosylhydrolase [Vicinamibacterales bacterium]
MRVVLALAMALAVFGDVEGQSSVAAVTTWRLDNLERLASDGIEVIGAPAIVRTDIGPAVAFNGASDGLLIGRNPIEGLKQFTIEVLFSADADGPVEQRFLHLQESAGENRALVELRLNGGRWALDSYLRHGDAQLTLLDLKRTHPAASWHVSSTTFDGQTLRHYVDGVEQGSGAVAFQPLRAGRTSIGVRQNRVSWFKGRIHTVRISPSALEPSQLLGVPRRNASNDWGNGIEGQRKADLGDGTFLNPIMPGDHPDPSILKDGDDYYMTFSSFDAYPGLVIWHSRDLVNWQVIGPALFKNVGSVWAPDLVKHNGRYYIYFPGISPNRSNYVIWADDIRGPWSAPIDLKLTRIDPGHAVGPDGTRYLFLSAGELVQLSDDGLSVVGKSRKIYDGWKYPAEWVVETFAQEGPKILKRGDYYYMVLAEGGTAGPPTGHMIVAARSKSIEGPWENDPHNPILRTQSRDERWWSKGHGTLVEDHAGRWWMVYHAYENGYYTLGRQTLLEPVEWTADGWFRMAGADPAKPIAKPHSKYPGPAAHGFAFSDDFSTSKMGVQWSFYAGDENDRHRYRYENGALVLRAKGNGPSDSQPLWFVNGDHSYEIEVEVEADAGSSAGLLVFYSRKLYAGLGISSRNMRLHVYGMDRTSAKPSHLGQHVWLRLRNDEHIVTLDYSVDGKKWERYDRAIEVSGYHHNVAYDFLSLRPALYASGEGEVRFRNFKYRALR